MFGYVNLVISSLSLNFTSESDSNNKYQVAEKLKFFGNEKFNLRKVLSWDSPTTKYSNFCLVE